MTEVQRKYLEWVGFNDYEIQEVETEIKNGEEIFIFEGFQFYAWESGYNKANEWHYIKDGDLPPLNTNVLVIHRWARTPEVGKRIEVFINSSVWVWAMCSDRYRYTSDDENVIAWKEIVLPKESE